MGQGICGQGMDIATRCPAPQPPTAGPVSGFVGAREEQGFPLAAVIRKGISPRIPLRCIRGYVPATPPGLIVGAFPWLDRPAPPHPSGLTPPSSGVATTVYQGINHPMPGGNHTLSRYQPSRIRLPTTSIPGSNHYIPGYQALHLRVATTSTRGIPHLTSG